MPLYFFDITEAGDTVKDEYGIVLADDSEARDQALALLPAIARDVQPIEDNHEFVAAVRNEAGQVVYEANLSLHGRWWPGRK